jgi:hypothetical protein
MDTPHQQTPPTKEPTPTRPNAAVATPPTKQPTPTKPAFQERVFSTSANVQEKTQNRMAFEHVEKWTLIAHNKELLWEKII